MNMPEGFLYTKEHEWAKIEGDQAKVGITDYAQSSLGDITFIELPKEGTEVEQSKGLATVESVKAASDVYAPLSGKITQVNNTVVDAPEVINDSPYEKGWLAVIELKDEKEKEKLMKPEDYRKYVETLK